MPAICRAAFRLAECRFKSAGCLSLGDVMTLPEKSNDPMSNLKLLFVDQSGQLGGAELALLETITRLQGPHRVCVFSEGPFPQKLREAGIETHVLDASSKLTSVSKYDR